MFNILYHHHHQSVLPKGRSFTGNSGIKVAVLPKGRYSTAYSRQIGAVASRCFLHPTLSLASEQTLKDLKRFQGHHPGGEESGFDYMGPTDFSEIHHKS